MWFTAHFGSNFDMHCCMIISILKLKPRPDQREPMLDIFRTVISLTNGRPGCMGCSTQEEDSSQ